MNSFLAALQFLTIVPIKISSLDGKKTAQSMAFFPLVGLLLGLALAGLNSLLTKCGFAQISINIILVVALAALTGGIHLDGLADTIDALSSAKKKEEMLAIMRDPHIGTMGVLGLAGILLLKIALISSLPLSIKISSLLLMCSLSRWSMVFATFLFPYARQEGKAKAFFKNINLRIFLLSTLIALSCSVATGGLPGIIVMLCVALSAYLIAKLVSCQISGITGDVLGAINELSELVVLFMMCFLGKNLCVV